MNPEDDEALYLDEDFIALLANLDLADLPGCSNTPSPAVNPSSRHAPPPRTPPRSRVAVNISPSPRTAPRSREAPLTSPSTPSRAPATPHSAITTPPRTHPHTSPHAGSGPTLYHFESPTRRGYTHDWYVAHHYQAAAKLISVGPRQVLQPREHRNLLSVSSIPAAAAAEINRTTQKRPMLSSAGADSVFFGPGKAETKPLVNSVPNNIFRGYYTVAEAQAAFQYALQRSWVRSVDTPVTAIPALPLPAPVIDSSNPLNGDETLDDTWYIVYRGITPGVYRSHLESQLNTLGIPGAIHESVEGKAAALDKYNAAVRRGEVRSVVPVYSPSVASDASPPLYTDVFS
ncbi:hypothetical protein B0H11DRAFT_2234603 [Mycena galericulata]|nr:hypothetical protein B0H11DRAFT_2234603 [Mycena galericulata]